MSTVDQIRNKIADGDLEDALEIAIGFLLSRDQDMHSECLHHKGRLSFQSKEYRKKIISHEVIEMTRAQVQDVLLDVVVRRIEELSKPNYETPFERPQQLTQQQTVTVNFGSGAAPTQPAHAGHVTGSSAASLADHAAARQLVEEFMKLLATYEVENAAWRAAPFLHRSLLQGELMQPQFKQNNFYNAHQRFRSYKFPVIFTKTQPTNRTAIGSLLDRDEGEEYVYTLEKTVDNGGMPGTVRVFFLKNGGVPKITLVSL